MKKLYIILLALCSFSLVGAQDFPREIIVNVQSILEHHSQQFNIKGLSASIILDDDSEYTWVQGTADGNSPVDATHLWHFASQAKGLLTTVVLMLHEEGLLSIDDPLDKYLPGFEHANSHLSIKRFLNHTSGSERIWSPGTPLWTEVWGKRDSIWDYEKPLSYIQDADDNEDPQYNYTSTNMWIIAKLVEAVTGNSVLEEINNRIIEPLDLSSSIFPTTNFDESKLNGIWAYNSGNPDNRSTWAHDSYLTSRISWISTINDPALFIRALHNGDLIKPETMALLYEEANGSAEIHTQPFDFTFTTSYGLGVSIVDWDGRRMYGHGGDGLSYSAAYHFPDGNVTISLVNNCFGSQVPILFLLEEIYQEIKPLTWTVSSESIPFEESDDITLYPNPAEDILNIQLELDTYTDINLSVIDISGRMVDHLLIQNHSYTPGKTISLPLSKDIRKGYYFLRIELGDKLLTRPFVVSR